MKISNKIGGRRKKRDFLVNFFQKVSQNATFGLFFLQNLPEALKILSKLVLYSVLGAFKINLILAEKKVRQNF